MIKRYASPKDRRAVRTRAKIIARAVRPRLSVFRSNKFLYAQVIDDAKGVTLAAAKGVKPEEVGTKVAKAAQKAKITTVVFDRGSYVYHGKIKQLAEAARAAGLSF